MVQCSYRDRSGATLPRRPLFSCPVVWTSESPFNWLSLTIVQSSGL
nr:MAG TPA: hypothetical protein [Caudoviricetes sp.]